MDQNNALQICSIDVLLGLKDDGRTAVDLLAEAARLNFSASEIAELQRLYPAEIKVCETKPDRAEKPQTAA
jgi:hypothetical protein